MCVYIIYIYTFVLCVYMFLCIHMYIYIYHTYVSIDTMHILHLLIYVIIYFLLFTGFHVGIIQLPPSKNSILLPHHMLYLNNILGKRQKNAVFFPPFPPSKQLWFPPLSSATLLGRSLLAPSSRGKGTCNNWSYRNVALKPGCRGRWPENYHIGN